MIIGWSAERRNGIILKVVTDTIGDGANCMQIAIDGPAGAGKSSVAKRIAEALNILYIDTGAMYRAITWKALHTGLSIEDQPAIEALAEHTRLDLKKDNQGLQVWCDDMEVTDAIRTPEVSRMVSRVSSYPGVRTAMVGQQQALGRRSDVVMDGRDITHVVLPEANYKFYFTASLEERARRRALELETKGLQIDLAQLTREIGERDRQDMERTVGPLKVASDAIVIDTSGLTEDQVVDRVLDIVRGR